LQKFGDDPFSQINELSRSDVAINQLATLSNFLFFVADGKAAKGACMVCPWQAFTTQCEEGLHSYIRLKACQGQIVNLIHLTLTFQNNKQKCTVQSNIMFGLL
jgi:hypothetical protein